MDKNELIKVLGELDNHLSSSFDIILIGGAAMILHFGASRTTRDVDVLILKGDTSDLRKAIKTVAYEQKFPDEWMSDAAKGFAEIFLSDFYHRLVPLDYEFRHIRLYALGLPEQVALKIIALREQDLEDLELLLPRLSTSDKEVVLGVMNKMEAFRPDWAQKMKYFLEEQGWMID